ncbi:MAG: AMP-binding protein [Candidatus Omnitrophica bacterium]|nr:AMP-binding protein [Candidatus Omnitrophota bacterium]
MRQRGITGYDQLLERARNYEWYWAEMAKELAWFKPWDKTLEWKLPFSKWFVGAQFNIVHNALDRHMKTSTKNKVAYIWESEPGEVERWTYEQLWRETNRMANALKRLGVAKGDRVTIYLPMIPQLPIAMLACAKIGAVHSVVFSGFSSLALKDRIIDAESKVVITANATFRRGKAVALKANTDAAMTECPSVKNVIVVRRTQDAVTMQPGRDLWWDEAAKKESDQCDTVALDSEAILFTLYTSGTTGKPKGIVHVHGGYAVGTAATLKYVFDIKDKDIFWCAADIGWITGHSYIVYAPLMLGATSIMYEGAPDWPEPDRWWKILEREKVTILYTSPTAIRMHMKYGQQWAAKHNLSSLRLLGSVGEPINPEAWRWYYEHIGGNRCPIMDTWWQTETGCFLVSPLPITPLKPGSATNPWPSMLRTIYKDPERYKQNYWSRWPGLYLTGDAAMKDEDGYIWFRGRADEVLNVAGHRLGTAEVESALVAHPAVAEAACIGVPHEVKGDVPKVYITLKIGQQPSEALVEELKKWVSTQIGPIARPEAIEFRDKLPKTRSGKIMRRLLKAQALGKEVGDISTLED